MAAPADTPGTGTDLHYPAVAAFRDKIYAYYRDHARSFPWRETTDPYCILVSEIMLQQTQAERVAQKYGGFISRFPDFQALAGAELCSVLEAWQGLGYNRRAVALKETARKVMEEHGGILPGDIEGLTRLPGIGRYTAGAVLAFAYNRPVAFIETNIRRVFIHCFFPESERVKDSEILPLVEQALDRENPRQWYYALMDYGAMLKAGLPNPNRKSAHYVRQAPFEGSTRQVRGMILKLLVSFGPLSETELIDKLDRDPCQVRQILLDLEREGFVRSNSGMVSIR
ncbi:MAG: A/G-specific adenine glycosylase [Desulfomonilia bacterium]